MAANLKAQSTWTLIKRRQPAIAHEHRDLDLAAADQFVQDVIPQTFFAVDAPCPRCALERVGKATADSRGFVGNFRRNAYVTTLPKMTSANV